MEKHEMRAAMYLAPEKIEIRQVPIPHVNSGEILVRVGTALTCGTDLKTYRRGHPKFPPPFIFGHEFGGEVVEVGKSVDRYKPGMRVTANVFAPCGDCFFCRKGQGNLCENLIYNFGAFAEYILLPEPIVRLTTYEIPSHLSYAEAAILEPLVSVVHSQRLIDIQPGEHVVVIGAGGAISLMHIQMAILSGATQIVAIGHNDFRLGLAGALGAADLINSKKTPDYLEKVNQLTHGRGADVVIECAGSKEAWEESIRLVRKGGRILWFGGLPGGTQVSLDANRIHYDELRLLGIHGGTIQDAEIAFELLTSGKIKSKPLISAEMPLEMLEEGLKRMASGEVVKVAINPGL